MELADYLSDQRARQLDELVRFASFPTISAYDEHRDDMLACSAWLQEHLTACGLERVGLHRAGGNPLVYGEWLHAGPDAPTILVYGHYDVQPADPIDQWTSPPFEPTVRDSRIYARGISDNKAQIFLALKAIESTLATEGALACNVKVIIDGEEELRADHLERFVAEQRSLLNADLLLNTDSFFLAPGVPSIPLGLRGMVALEFTVTTAAGDLHSGMFGGVVPNALHTMSDLLSSLHGEDGRVLVDGFYDDVREPSGAERAAWRELPVDEQGLLEQSGAWRLTGDARYTALERLWARPSLDVNGMWGGFEDQGVMAVVPARAHAKLSCFLAPGQRMEHVLERIAGHLTSRLPDHARLTIDASLAGAPAMLLLSDHPGIRAASEALAVGFGRPAVTTRLGAAVPINEIADRLLGMPAVMLGFCSPTDAFHAPDEHFDLASFDAGLRTFIAFLPALADEKARRLY